MHTARLLPLLQLSLLPALTGALPGLAQVPENDPVLGTWELDVERSLFENRARPLSQRRIYERHPEGLQATIITRNASGTEVVTRYVAEYDGAPSPLTGSASIDGVILRRSGPRSAIATLTHAGIEVGRAERTVSENGNEMTVRVELRGDVSSRAVYRKVP